MGEQYRVDLSSLEDVVTKLNNVMNDLGNANSDTKYKTYLSPSALGANAPDGVEFQEAKGLTTAHQTMKTHIEEVVEHLNELMEDFGKKTQQTRDTYQRQEDDVTQDMSGG